MTYSIQFEWRKPMNIDRDDLNRLSVILEEARDRAKKAITAQTSYRTDQFPTSKSLIEKLDNISAREPEWTEVRRLANQFEYIEAESLTVYFRGGSSHTLDSIEKMGDKIDPYTEIIERVSVGVGSFTGAVVFVDLRDRWSSAATVALTGEVGDCKKIQDDIRSLFGNCTRYWWPARDGRLFWVWMALGAVLWTGSTIYQYTSGPAHSAYRLRPGDITTIVTGAIVLLPIVTAITIGGWSWLFPRLEFATDGNARRYQLRTMVRNVIFVTVPLAIVLPVALALWSKS